MGKAANPLCEADVTCASIPVVLATSSLKVLFHEVRDMRMTSNRQKQMNLPFTREPGQIEVRACR